MELWPVSNHAGSTVYPIRTQMNADSHFEIGKDHLVCEDYALTRYNSSGAFAIVSDGCSSSPSVDFGARILTYSAMNTIYQGPTDYQTFGRQTIENAGKIFEVFPHLHRQSLDATLLVVALNEKTLKVYMYGDGVFCMKYAKGGSDMIHVSFPSGAPAYLSYYLNDDRMTDYQTMVDKKIVQRIHTTPDGVVTIDEREVVPFAPVVFEPDVYVAGDILSVSTDGINSFRKADSDLMPWTELTDEFFNYKNTAGVFVARRLAAFQRKCLKEQITHFDDIAVASIVL